MGMIDQLSGSLNLHQEALNLRVERQKVLASNIANADTPNYKARDFDFSSELSRVMKQGRASGDGLERATTSSRHIPAQGPAANPAIPPPASTSLREVGSPACLEAFARTGFASPSLARNPVPTRPAAGSPPATHAF